MVAASYVFYAWWNPRFVILIVVSTIVNTICGRVIHRATQQVIHRATQTGTRPVASISRLGSSSETHTTTQTPGATTYGSALTTQVGAPTPKTTVATTQGSAAHQTLPIPQAGSAATRLASPQKIRQITLAVAVIFNLALLAVFKYFDFFISSFQDLLESFGLGANLPLLRVVLPVGISFFTFQALSYVIDIYRRKIPAAGLLDFAVFLAFFPQLVAGPIVRASEFLPQLAKRLNPGEIDFTRAAVLIGAGLFKKVVVADYLAATLVDDVFSFPSRFSGLEILLGVYGYAIQIYADFSGYTDIAIGVALLLGFRFPENFNQPYRAVSIQDFWRRWHMTLSRWLRDYLYIPLGGNRDGRLKRDRNLALTMILGGLWHGAGWPFFIWGAYQGAGLLLERRAVEALEATREKPATSPSATQPPTQPPQTAATPAPPSTTPPAPHLLLTPSHQPATPASHQPPLLPLQLWLPVLKWLATFHFVCLGWIFFRAQTVGDAADIIARLFGSFTQPTPQINWAFVGVIVAGLVVQLLPRSALAVQQSRLSHLPVWVTATGFGIWVLVVVQFSPEGLSPFIYFQF